MDEETMKILCHARMLLAPLKQNEQYESTIAENCRH